MSDIVSDLRLHWKCNDGVGSDFLANDGTGLVGSGILTNHPDSVDLIIDNHHYKYINYGILQKDFNGEVQSANPLDIPYNSDKTYSFWLRNYGDSFTGYQPNNEGVLYPINTHNGSSYGTNIYMPNSTTIQFQPGTGSTDGPIWTGGILDNLNNKHWHHIAISYSYAQSGVYLWMDGQYVDSGNVETVGGGYPNNHVRLWEPSGTSLATAKTSMTEIRIYDRLLATDTDTSDNIAALYSGNWEPTQFCYWTGIEPVGANQSLLIKPFMPANDTSYSKATEVVSWAETNWNGTGPKCIIVQVEDDNGQVTGLLGNNAGQITQAGITNHILRGCCNWDRAKSWFAQYMTRLNNAGYTPDVIAIEATGVSLHEDWSVNTGGGYLTMHEVISGMYTVGTGTPYNTRYDRRLPALEVQYIGRPLSNELVPVGDNTSGPIDPSGTPFSGMETAGSYLDVGVEDGTYHNITATGGEPNNINIVYEFNYDPVYHPGRAKVRFKGYVNDVGELCRIQAFDFVPGKDDLDTWWDNVLSFPGKAGSSNDGRDIILSMRHIYGFDDENNKIYLRLKCEDGTTPDLFVDRLRLDVTNRGPQQAKIIWDGYVDYLNTNRYTSVFSEVAKQFAPEVKVVAFNTHYSEGAAIQNFVNPNIQNPKSGFVVNGTSGPSLYLNDEFGYRSNLDCLSALNVAIGFQGNNNNVIPWVAGPGWEGVDGWDYVTASQYSDLTGILQNKGCRYVIVR